MRHIFFEGNTDELLHVLQCSEIGYVYKSVRDNASDIFSLHQKCQETEVVVVDSVHLANDEMLKYIIELISFNTVPVIIKGGFDKFDPYRSKRQTALFERCIKTNNLNLVLKILKFNKIKS